MTSLNSSKDASAHVKQFDLHDETSRTALCAAVREVLHQTYSGHKPPPFRRDMTNPGFVAAHGIFHDALEGSATLEQLIAAIPKNFQIIPYAITEYLKENGYAQPTSDATPLPGIQQLFVAVTEEVSTTLGVCVQIVQREWVDARQFAKDALEKQTGARPGNEVPDEAFLDALSKTSCLGEAIRYSILIRLRQAK